MSAYDKHRAKMRDTINREGTTMQVIVYSKPSGHCPNCEWVKAQLQHAGVNYSDEVINEDVLEYAKQQGFRAAPIVIAVEADGSEIEFAGRDESGLARIITAARRENL